MNKAILYKYINLLFRIALGLGAVWFIYLKIHSDFLIQLNSISLDSLKFSYLAGTFGLLFFNWGIEAAKWKFAIREQIEITLLKALRYTFTGITIGIMTPNRIGEIPARAMLLKSTKFKEVVLKTTASSFSQVVITFLLGGIAVVFVNDLFNFGIFGSWLVLTVVVGQLILLGLYFNMNRLSIVLEKINFFKNDKVIIALKEIQFKELSILLSFSFARYLVFFLQYWLVLKVFGIQLVGVNEIFLISFCFLLASTIPTILFSEIGVRGSVALFVFGVVSDLDIQIVLASIILWLINVAIPAIIGLYDLKQVNLFKAN